MADSPRLTPELAGEGEEEALRLLPVVQLVVAVEVLPKPLLRHARLPWAGYDQTWVSW